MHSQPWQTTRSCYSTSFRPSLITRSSRCACFHSTGFRPKSKSSAACYQAVVTVGFHSTGFRPKSKFLNKRAQEDYHLFPFNWFSTEVEAKKSDGSEIEIVSIQLVFDRSRSFFVFVLMITTPGFHSTGFRPKSKQSTLIDMQLEISFHSTGFRPKSKSNKCRWESSPMQVSIQLVFDRSRSVRSLRNLLMLSLFPFNWFSTEVEERFLQTDGTNLDVSIQLVFDRSRRILKPRLPMSQGFHSTGFRPKSKKPV